MGLPGVFGAPQALGTPPRKTRPFSVGSLVVIEPVTGAGGGQTGVPPALGVAVRVGVRVAVAVGAGPVGVAVGVPQRPLPVTVSVYGPVPVLNCVTTT